ncbi:MAG: DUF4234 domain-containing protein [Clostridia bacterium]|nr:DUF4234 domain-containing protein [Clostridia bacterium]
MLKNRSVISVVLFSILTCGIYMIWWTYVTCTDLQTHGRKTSVPPVLTTLMMLFFSSVGGALLGFDADENINSIKAQNGMPQTDNKVLWLILGIFIPIVTVALVQYEINNMIAMAQRNAAWQQYNQNNGQNNGQV